jgi:dienelactone hydrolase
MTKNFWILFSACVGLFVPVGRGAEVIKSDVEGQEFVADFYCSRDSTNKLGILFLGGSEGGKPAGWLAKLFAEKGYPSLAVAYFKEKGLPETLQSIPLEYFDKPLTWMEHNEKIPKGGIVVVGASRGAELALLLASIKPEIRGVIALSPSSVVWFGLPKELPILSCSSWTFNGKPVPFMPYYFNSNVVPADMHAIYTNLERALADKGAVEKAAIKVEQIHGPVLLASGHDDEICPAEEMGDAICSRLKERGFKYSYEHLKYKNAGHTMDERWMMGGTFEGNKKARIDLIERMFAFLNAFGSK